MPAQDPSPSVHPELAAHQAAMEKRIYSIGGRYHMAFAYAVSNCTMIEGDDGVILVDTLTSVESAETVAAAFREITPKPIKAIIYTHFHADHVSGAKAFVSEDDVAAGKVKIYGHQDLTDHVLRDVGLIAPVLGRRALYQFGMRLPIGEDGTLGAGLGPPQRPGTRTFIAPTDTFTGSLKLEIAGVALDPAQTLDGLSIVPLLKDPAAKLPRQTFCWHYPLAKPHFLGGRSTGSIRQGDWKLIEFFETDKCELYDMQLDTGEKNDLAAKLPQRVATMRRQLQAWRKTVGAKIPAARKAKT